MGDRWWWAGTHSSSESDDECPRDKIGLRSMWLPPALSNSARGWTSLRFRENFRLSVTKKMPHCYVIFTLVEANVQQVLPLIWGHWNSLAEILLLFVSGYGYHKIATLTTLCGFVRYNVWLPRGVLRTPCRHQRTCSASYNHHKVSTMHGADTSRGSTPFVSLTTITRYLQYPQFVWISALPVAVEDERNKLRNI